MFAMLLVKLRRRDDVTFDYILQRTQATISSTNPNFLLSDTRSHQHSFK